MPDENGLQRLIGHRLRNLRKRKGLTLENVASAVGSTPQTIQRLETNNMTINIEWLEKMCAVLDVQPIVLFDVNFNNRIGVSLPELKAITETLSSVEEKLQKLRHKIETMRFCDDE